MDITRCTAAAALVVFAACSGGQEEAAPPGDPEPAPVDVAPAEPASPWTRLDDADLAVSGDVGQYGALLAGEDGTWMLAGSVRQGSGLPRPAVWTSADGASWERTTLDADGGARIHGATTHDGVTVLVGQRGGRPEEPAAVFVRDGSADFEEVAAEALEREGGLRLREVVAVDDGFVAAGEEAASDAVVVLRSPDGRRWEEVAGKDLGSVRENVEVRGLVPGPGGLVLVGSDPGSPNAAPVWYSADGQSWELAGNLTEDGPVHVGGAAADDDGYVITGTLRVGSVFEPRIWRSADGRSWDVETVVLDTEPSSDLDPWGSGFVSLARGPGGWVAGVYHDATNRLVRSADARSWTEVDLPSDPPRGDRPWLNLHAERDGTLLTASSTGWPHVARIEGGASAYAAGRPLPAPPANLTAHQLLGLGDDVIVLGGFDIGRATGPPDVGAAVWRVDAGGQVERLEEAVHDGAYATGAMAGASGELLLVGYEAFNPVTHDARTTHASAWRWTPGGAWEHRVDGDLEWDTNARMFAGAFAHEVAVAAGTRYVGDDLTPSFWTSDDGFAWRHAVSNDAERERGGSVSLLCASPQGFLAFGHRPNDSGIPTLVWSSAQGRSWDLVSETNEPFSDRDVVLHGCATTDDGVLVVGSAGDPRRPAAWTTSDGRTFAPVDPDAFGVGRRGTLRGVAIDPDGVAWVVGDVDDDDGSRTLLLYRGGGDEWERIALDGEEFRTSTGGEAMQDVHVDRGRVLLLGTSGDGVVLWAADREALEGSLRG